MGWRELWAGLRPWFSTSHTQVGTSLLPASDSSSINGRGCGQGEGEMDKGRVMDRAGDGKEGRGGRDKDDPQASALELL